MAQLDWNSARARRLAWLAIALYLVGLGIAATLRKQGDFAVYWLAGQRALHGASLYPRDDSSRFLYAPIFGIAFIPFGAMSRHAAQFAFFAVNAIALLAFITGARRMLFGREPQASAALLFFPVLLCARFIDNNIEHGQINILTLALIAWAIISAEEERPARAGLMLALAILIKPFALLAGLYLMLRRRIGALCSAAAAIAGLLLLPALFFGPHAALAQTAGYLQAVSSMSGRYRWMLTNQSASSAMIRLLAPNGATGAGLLSENGAMMLGLGFELLAVAAVAFWQLRSRADGLRALFPLCALFCLMASFAPVSWKSYYAALLVPYTALLADLWVVNPKPAPLAKALIALSVILNLASGKWLNELALFYSTHFFSSLVLLMALVAAAQTQEERPALEVEIDTPLKATGGLR